MAVVVQVRDDEIDITLTGRFTVRDRKGERAFLSVYRDRELLAVETSVPRPRYVILQHPDRHDLAWWIGERVQPAR